MTGPALDDLPRAPRRRLFVRAALRATLTVAFLVAVYYRVPLDGPFSTDVGVRLALWLVVVAALILFQARGIARSPYPLMRAIGGLGTSLPLFLLVFAAAYFKIETAWPGSFTQVMTRTDALYFTVTVFSSTGFGDIAPASETARVLTMVQMLGDLVVLGFVARVIIGAVKTGLQRQAVRTGPAEHPSPGSAA